MQCLLLGDESEEEVQRRVWRGPRMLCHRGDDGEAADERSGFGGFALSHGVWWGSGTTTQVLHGGGLLGVVGSVFLDFL